MCTVTVVPLGGAAQAGWDAYRLACNRDEQRTRPPAAGPRPQHAGALRAIWPVDPVGGGTWVGANECGVVLSLLNRNIEPAGPHRNEDPRESRGAIIPAALEQPSLAAVARFLKEEIDPKRYPPFRLIGVDGINSLVCEGTGATLRVEVAPLGSAPLFITSSGLGDALVEGPRRALFNEWFFAEGESVAGGASAPAQPRAMSITQRQDAFHRHSWPDRTHLSVCMRRDAARTVSFTAVTVSPDVLEFHYHAGPPDETAAETTIPLPRRRSD
ncbi:MAG: NRDE family protein [Phycisphaerae bacterium]|nr:NRDE family protein [Phycisphaerae bacterium]